MSSLDQKFIVSRTDPEAQERHSDCAHFVLDVDHDPHAAEALMAYARSVAVDDPELAAAVFELALKEPWARRAVGAL